MAQVVISEEYLSDIAQALRVKLGTSESFKPSQMANGIRRLPTAPRVISKNITANGTYSASTDGADGYSPIAVNVANSYTQSDEGKVVNSGALVSQSSQTITQNGTYNTTLNNQIVANVPNTYGVSDEGKVVNNASLVAQTNRNINANGTYDTTLNNSIEVDVPNTYAAGDEGKVVSNSTLVAQTAHAEVTQNGTYDTTLNDEVTVNVSGGGNVKTAKLKLGGSNAIINASGNVISMASQTADYLVPLKNDGTEAKLDLSSAFEIACRFKCGSTPSSSGHNVWGSSNSYYHCPTICAFNNKIGYFVTTNGDAWQYSGIAITPDGWTFPTDTWITVRLTWDGTDFTFYVDDGSNEYTATLNEVTPYYNINYGFEFGGQNRSSYSIATLNASIDLAETYLKQGNDYLWKSQSSVLVAKTITQNGTYNASSDSADGDSSVEVNVSGGGTSIPSFKNSTWFFTKALDSQKLYSRIGKALDRSNYGIFNESADVISEIAFADLAALISADMFLGFEHYDYVNSDMITALGLVELGRDLASGSSIVLSDSIANYSAIVAQGVYYDNVTSEYNTTIIYHNPRLNTQYWTGMKDRNTSYDRYFTFTSNTDVVLSGGSSNRGIILWGMP